MFDDQMRETARRAVLCWLATADADGRPNVSPKEIFTLHDGPQGGEALMALIMSPGSARNISANPWGCVSFVDPFAEEGLKIEGPADILRQGAPGYAERAGPLEALAGPNFPFKAMIRVRARKTSPIVAPGAVLFPDRDRAAQRRKVLARYGVPEG